MLPLAITLLCTSPGSGVGALLAQPLPESRVEAWRQARVLSRRPRLRSAAPRKRRSQGARRQAPRPVPRQPIVRDRSVYRLGRTVLRTHFVIRVARTPVTRLPPVWLPSPPPRRVIHHTLLRPRPAARPQPLVPSGGCCWQDRRVGAPRHRAISGAACLARLRELKVPFKRSRPRRGIATPVVITGPINGVKLKPMWGRRPALMDCRFALTLYRIAPIVRRVGFDELRYSAFYSYRNVAGTRRLSRHGNGLAADLFEIRGPGGLRANVLKDWVKAVGRPGDCVAGVTKRKARLLRRLACALEHSGILFQVLTPDSNYAHRNHFHLSGLRPGERPLRNRYCGRR